ncbi:LysR family transcriptional regulator [Shewanella dokdonensis]|uniref:LysR family transcriptional regulator n=1 Tax=Shewanella dokdonensis TaxID=712036 RepID=UPI0020104556|nr:LysR family transcriptional regulator [Shewanella dokdonensis]MCL1076234.1 LysR family transcriptional regulator [Shewanella dokdonensis]
MSQENFNDLYAFVCVAQEGSFTKAAARLNISQSALSQTVRNLEQRMGIRLLSRTTRSVATTHAGERLFIKLAPLFEDVTQELQDIGELRDCPRGIIRITTPEHAIDQVLWPVVKRFMDKYPDVTVELNADNRLVDIVGERFDAGVRLGEMLAKDMVAMPITPELRIAVTASAAYLAKHGTPSHPKELMQHRCINWRLPTAGGLLPWEFERGSEKINIRPNNSLILNTSHAGIQAALDGMGIFYTMEEKIVPYLNDGRLVRILEDWCQPFPGFYLYYPSRHHRSQAFSLFLEELRYRGE